MSVAECKSPVVKRIRENGRVKWRWSIAEEKERETEGRDGWTALLSAISCFFWRLVGGGPAWPRVEGCPAKSQQHLHCPLNDGRGTPITSRRPTPDRKLRCGHVPLRTLSFVIYT